MKPAYTQYLDLLRKSPSTSGQFLAICLVVMIVTGSQQANGAAWVADSEGTETRWNADLGSGPAKVVQHDVVRLATDEPGRDRGSERITYLHPPGIACWFWMATPPAAVIDDLRISVDLRANGPGTQLAAEIVLPRISDPKTGQAMRLVVRPTVASVTQAGETRLALSEIPKLLKNRLRAELLRRGRQNGISSTDYREAYVARVALIAPGDIKPRTLWVHELRVDGLAAPLRLAQETKDSAKAKPEEPHLAGNDLQTEVVLNSDGFLIDQRPYFVRAWAWRGEELADVAERGFNTVLLDRIPSTETLREATAAGMKALCPPPTVVENSSDNSSWDSVIGWVIATRGTEQGLDGLLSEVERVRAFPAHLQKPVLIKVGTSATNFGRLADGILIDTQGSLHDDPQGQIHQIRSFLATVRPGTPWIAVTPTDLDPQSRSQLDALIGEAAVSTWLPPGHLSDSVYTSVAMGCRGVALTSVDGLSGVDAPTRLANIWFVALNSHLQLIEPWIVSQSSTSSLYANQMTILERQGVRLAFGPLLRNSHQAGTVLPGVAESAYVFRLTPSALHNVKSKRVAGGLRIETPESSEDFTLPGAYVLSNDPRVTTSLRQYTSEKGQQTTRTWILTADEAIQQSQALDPSSRTKARSLLQNAKLAAARRDYATAYDQAHAALTKVDTRERERTRIASQLGKLMQSSPLTVLPATLTDHFRLAQLIDSGRRGPNRLAAGSFEDLDYARSEGWRRHDVGEGDFAIEIASGSSIAGDHHLLMSCRDPNRVGSQAPKISSPRIEIDSGELIEIVGWVRVASLGIQPTGRLSIADSLGGSGLSLHVDPTTEWQPFRLIRRAPEATSLRLELTLEGAAEAQIDGVMVRSIEIGPSQRQVRPKNLATRPASAQAK